jgi:hypothetical protein
MSPAMTNASAFATNARRHHNHGCHLGRLQPLKVHRPLHSPNSRLCLESKRVSGVTSAAEHDTAITQGSVWTLNGSTTSHDAPDMVLTTGRAASQSYRTRPTPKQLRSATTATHIGCTPLPHSSSQQRGLRDGRCLLCSTLLLCYQCLRRERSAKLCLRSAPLQAHAMRAPR